MEQVRDFSQSPVNFSVHYSASGVRYQNPDYSACTAATVLMSLTLSVVRLTSTWLALMCWRRSPRNS